MSNLDTDFWDRQEIEDLPEEEDQMSEDNSSYDLSDDVSYEEIFEEDEVEVEDSSSVINNARIRLEQGRLYEMLIKHNLFDGVDAVPQAIEKVQSEIKQFIVERLEILLGMRAEKEKEVHRVVTESQFNDVEVRALRMIASKVTKGASELAPVHSPRNELNAIKNTAPTKPMLNNIKPKTKPTVDVQKKNHREPVKTVAKPQARPQPKPQARPQAKTRPAQELSQDIHEDMSPEAVAKRDMKYIDSLKKMSLQEANKIVSEKYVRPQGKIKMDQESINRLYTTRVAVDETAQTFAKLLAAAKKV